VCHNRYRCDTLCRLMELIDGLAEKTIKPRLVLARLVDMAQRIQVSR
jgi:hypothetical protein